MLRGHSPGGRYYTGVRVFQHDLCLTMHSCVTTSMGVCHFIKHEHTSHVMKNCNPLLSSATHITHMSRTAVNGLVQHVLHKLEVARLPAMSHCAKCLGPWDHEATLSQSNDMQLDALVRWHKEHRASCQSSQFHTPAEMTVCKFTL